MWICFPSMPLRTCRGNFTVQFTDSAGAPLASNITSATISMKRHDFPFGGSFDVSQVSACVVVQVCSCPPAAPVNTHKNLHRPFLYVLLKQNCWRGRVHMKLQQGEILVEVWQGLVVLVGLQRRLLLPAWLPCLGCCRCAKLAKLALLPGTTCFLSKLQTRPCRLPGRTANGTKTRLRRSSTGFRQTTRSRCV